MKVIQLYFKVFLLRDIRQEDSLNSIASFIDEVLGKEERWLALHNKNCYKYYVFNSFYPTETDGIYKKERVYQIVVRGIDQELMQYFAENLPKHENSWMKGLIVNRTFLFPRRIASLYSLTPVIVKGKNQNYWRDDMSMAAFSERIRINLIKKYKNFTNEEIDEDFILCTQVELTNKQPIRFPYKGITLLADKIQMQIADNPTAQQLAFLGLGVGVCEINSRGAGFVNAHFAE